MTRPRMALAALAGLCALALPTPASAAASFTWIEAPCATGAITRYAGSGDGRVSLAGWIRPCGEPRPDASFGIMLYHESAARLIGGAGQMVTPYASTTAPTEFTVDYNMDSREIVDLTFGALRAICVVRGHSAPVACVAIDRPTGSGAPLVTPLSPDDPRVVDVPRIWLPPGSKTDPVCGNCA